MSKNRVKIMWRPQKKVLSLVLCVAMMLSVMVVGAGAAFSDQSSIKNTEAVDMCTALNIIGGYPDGSFKPEGNITRAEVTKMICVALNGGKDPNVTTNTTPTFSDVRGTSAAWAEGYIESCYAQGIISGVGGGRFNPAGNVTGTELAKMLLVALGYNSDNEGFTGNAWATNVNVRASQKGLYEGLESLDTSAALTRDNAAQMVWNALQAYEVEYRTTLVTENGQLTSQITVQDKVVGSNNDKITLMEDKYSANDDHEGALVGFTYNDTKGEWTYYVQESTATGAAPVQYKSTNDYTDLYRQHVSIVYKEKSNGTVDSVYGIYTNADDSQVLVSGLIGDLDDVSAGTRKSVKIDSTTYDLANTAANTPVYFFTYGATGDTTAKNLYTYTAADVVQLDAFAFDAIDENSDNDIDFFVVYPYAVGQVSLLNNSKIGLKSLNDSNAANLTTGGTVTLDRDDVDAYSGIARDDYVIYTPAAYTATNTDTIEQVSTVLNATVSRVSGTDVTIDSTVYTNYTTKDVDADSRVSDAVVVNGYIFLMDSTGSVDAYALLVSYSNGSNSVNGEQAKLLFSDGEKEVVDIKSIGTGVLSYDTNNALIPVLVTYTKNSSNEYTLTKAETSTATGTGFDKITAANWNSFSSSDLSSGKIKYINGDVIADDAVIFVTDKDDSKVITGAQLKRTSSNGLTVAVAYADENSSNGYDTVQLAYVTTANTVQSGESEYGYVVASPANSTNSDGDRVTELRIWNGSEIITLNTTDRSVAANVVKGSVIEYTLNTDGDVDDVKEIMDSSDYAAITSYDGTYVRFQGIDTDGNYTNTKRYEIVDDTVILYIDNDEVVGYADGSIQIAADKDATTGEKYANAIYIANSDDELDLLVIDINNDIANEMDD